MTLSFQNGSSYCFRHNDRDADFCKKETHIDPNGEHETWYKESLPDAYKRLFGDAVEAYNAKQKRADRRIDDYLAKVRKDKKKHDCYECIVQVGSKSDRCDPKIGKKILKQFVADWPERNPTLAIVGAYYHADEQGAPHVHIDYVPCAVGYRNGMSKQNGLEKALWNINPDLYKCHEKQGKGVYTTGQMAWQQHERDVLEELCTEHGIHITRGTDTHAKHKSVDLYKREKAVEAREADLDAREQRLMQLETVEKNIKQDVEAEFKTPMYYADAVKNRKWSLDGKTWDWLVDRYKDVRSALVAVLCHREWRKTIASIKVDTNIHDNGRSR